MEKLYTNGLKIILIIFLSIFIFNSGNVCVAADNLQNAFGNGPLKNTGGAAGYNTGGDDTKTPLLAIIQTIINVTLSVMGIIFLVLMVYAGYNWMTARGDEPKVTKAKEIITQSIIGIIIVIGAYAISVFVVSRIEKGTLKGASAGKMISCGYIAQT